MVLIHVKAAAAEAEQEEREFLYECPGSSTVDDVANAILDISRLQSLVHSLSHQLRRCLLAGDLKEISPDVVVALDRTLLEAETYASKDQVLHKRALSIRALSDHLRNVEKEVVAAHTKGLCGSEVLQLFSDSEHHEDTQLWWAGKELKSGNKLFDYIGQNEKTKIIIRLRPTFSESDR